MTVAPEADPDAVSLQIDTLSIAMKDTSPAGAAKVTEIGWYCANATEAADFEVGIYDHNPGDDNPENLVGKSIATAKGTDAGWKKVTGLNIEISAETVYWIAVQLDDTATKTDMNVAVSPGDKKDQLNNETELVDPWGVSDSTAEHLCGFYAICGAAAPEAGKSAGCISKEGPSSGLVPGLYE